MPDDIASAARRQAEQRELSLSAYVTDLIRRDLAAARRQRFWGEVERTMGTPDAQEDLAAENAAFDNTLGDGIDL
jgi:hypothetical protein